MFKRDRCTILHWLYLPDSYDAWISDVEIEQDPEIPPLPEGAWHVHARWLLDLEEFNEWLNEEDYLFVPDLPVS